MEQIFQAFNVYLSFTAVAINAVFVVLVLVRAPHTNLTITFLFLSLAQHVSALVTLEVDLEKALHRINVTPAPGACFQPNHLYTLKSELHCPFVYLDACHSHLSTPCVANGLLQC